MLIPKDIISPTASQLSELKPVSFVPSRAVGEKRHLPKAILPTRHRNGKKKKQASK